MKQLRERWRQLVNRIDALSLRERGFILVAVLAVLWAAWDLFLMQPLVQQQEASQARIEQLRTEASRLDDATRQMIERGGVDPDRRLREEIVRLRQELAELDAELEDRTADLIEPRQMARMLEEVLTRETDLRLVSLRNLDARPLVESEDAEGERAHIYRHGVAIEFSGTYLSTLAYLQAVEELPWRFFWDSIHLEVERHPRARVRIVVFTLGTREGMLGV